MPAVEPAEVKEVFEYWIAELRSSGRGVTPKLSDKRRRKITRAISLYGKEVCLKAIDGNKSSDWHQGANDRGKAYNDIELILRDEEHIERFANMGYEAEEGGGGAADFLSDDQEPF